MHEEVALLTHEGFPDRAKTAIGVLRYADTEVTAVVDRQIAESDPDARVNDYVPDVQDAPIVGRVAETPEFDALIIGVAPIGGGFDRSWRPDVRTALQRGADVVAGLHYFLNDDEEFAQLAKKHGCELRDVRRPPSDLGVADGIARDLDAHIVLTVGTDCSVGKMTTTRELYEEALDAGIDAAFVPTGQTGIIIEGWGIPIDRTISDFTAGAVERMCIERADDHDVLFVEGQGAITHPAYSAVTCGILHGAQPDALVLCHTAGREAVHGYESYDILPVAAMADLYESLAAPVAPTTVAGGALNTSALDAKAARTAVTEYGEAIGAQAVDPVRNDATPLLEAVL